MSDNGFTMELMMCLAADTVLRCDQCGLDCGDVTRIGSVSGWPHCVLCKRKGERCYNNI